MTLSLLAHSKDEVVETKAWFKLKTPKFMTVQYKDNKKKDKDLRKLTITDEYELASIKKTIETLPTQANEFIKMDPSKVVEVTLTFTETDPTVTEPKSQDIIQFFSGSIKAPNHAFFEKTKPEIKALYAKILTALHPKYNTPTVRLKDTPIKFPDFDITYKGSDHYQDPHVTVSWSDDRFTITPIKGDPLELKVRSGQLPPEPVPFKIGTKKFKLITYDSKDDKMFANSFKIKK